MNGFALLYRSTIGQKVAMAASGLLMVGWLFLHMAGNTLLFIGPEALNAYGEKLQGSGPLIWINRIVMLSAIAIHIASARALTMRNMAARPEAYAAGRKDQRTTYAARFMMIGGLTILLFIIYHLLHFTVGAAHGDFRHGDVYHNVVSGFQNPLVAGFYILAQLALAAHLFHGVWSSFQTLGLNHPKYESWRTNLAVGIPALICGVNITFPLSVLLGFVK